MDVEAVLLLELDPVLELELELVLLVDVDTVDVDTVRGVSELVLAEVEGEDNEEEDELREGPSATTLL